MRYIFKFGGSSLLDADGVKRAAEVVRNYVGKGCEVAVVSSALSGVTNQLLEVAESAESGALEPVKRMVQELAERHLTVVNQSVKDEGLRRDVTETLKAILEELERVLTGISYLGELTRKSGDYVLSFGEQLSTPILCAALADLGLMARAFTGGEAGVVTDTNFGEARPLMELTKHQVELRIGGLLTDGIIPVVAGFIATSQDGSVTTLGRGGSDYTATILGAALKADEVWLWSDVDGLMTTDPKVEPGARTIPEISFEEAVEMAIFGAKRMHPRALEPAMAEGIPVRIRNAFKPEAPGTLITSAKRVRTEGVVKALTLFRNVALVTVSGFGMVGTPGTAAKVFDVLGKSNVNILMISQSSSEANISLIVPRELLGRAVNALETALLGGNLIRGIEMEEDVCVIAAVGAGMRGTPGVAAKLFNAIAQKGINVRMIAQGSSELNISFAVKEADGEEAVRALHQEFKLALPEM